MRLLLLLVLSPLLALAQSPLTMPLDETPSLRPLYQPKKSAPIHYQLEATLSNDTTHVTGNVEITFRNTSRVGLKEALIWLYPNRFTQRPKHLSEMNQTSYYRGKFEPSSMELTSVYAQNKEIKAPLCEDLEGGEKTLCRLPLEKEAAPGEEVSLQVGFTTYIPKRYGRFGREEGAVMLDGGFYPALVFLGEAGFERKRPIQAASYSVLLSAPAWDGPFWVNGEGPLTDSLLREFEAPYASWILLPSYHVKEIEVLGKDQKRIATVQYFYFDSLYHDRVNEEGAEAAGPPGLNVDMWRDYPEEVASSAAKGLAFLASLGVPLDDVTVRLLEVPIREHISRTSPGLVLVSDRAMKIYPGNKFQKFHTLQILRAVYARLIEDRSQAFEREEDLAWAADALGAYLSDLYHHEFYRRPEFAKEILKPYAFISEFDRLRWVPQVPFQDAYFKTSYEKDLFLDDVRRFPSDWPYGKLLYQKLKALLGEEAFKGFARAYLAEAVPFRALSARVYGAPLDWFYAQWLRAHPKVNYKLVSLASTPTKEGFQHQVVVQREGDTWVKEPVEVLMIYEDETLAFMTWPFDAVRHTFTWTSPQKLSKVKIDPEERLYEYTEEDATTAKYDNDSSPTWRPVLEDFYGDVSSGGFRLITLGTARRANDKRDFYLIGGQLTSGKRLTLSNGQTLLSDDFELAFIGYRRGFGESLNEDLLRHYVTLTLGGQRVGPRILEEESLALLPAAFGKLSLVWSYTERQSYFLSWRGNSAEVSLSYNAGGALPFSSPDPSFSVERPCDALGLCQSVSVSGDVNRLFSLDGGRLFGLRLNAASIVGDPFEQDLLDLGGERNLKGYPINTIEGRARLFGSLEYRHPVIRGMDVNLAELDRWRGGSVVLWLTGATISGRDALLSDPSRPLFGRESLFAESGVGLRLWGDVMGVDPTLLSIDFTVPLVGNERFGGPFPAVQVHVGFEENF